MKDLTYTFAYIYFGAWGVAAVGINGGRSRPTKATKPKV